MAQLRLSVTLAAAALACTAAEAAQTVIYAYDALGRLTQTQTQSGAEIGMKQVFAYDAAGNRTHYQVSGSTAGTPVTLSMSNLVINQTLGGTPLTVNFGGSVDGTVTFTENGVFLGSTWVDGGQASIIFEDFPKGVHTITVAYSGDGTHAAKSMTFTIKVQDLSWLPAVLELLSN